MFFPFFFAALVSLAQWCTTLCCISLCRWPCPHRCTPFKRDWHRQQEVQWMMLPCLRSSHRDTAVSWLGLIAACSAWPQENRCTICAKPLFLLSAFSYCKRQGNRFHYTLCVPGTLRRSQLACGVMLYTLSKRVFWSSWVDLLITKPLHINHFWLLPHRDGIHTHFIISLSVACIWWETWTCTV